MARRRKRKRNKATFGGSARPVKTIRALLPDEQNVFCLLEFLGRYAPNLEVSSSIQTNDYNRELLDIVLVPMETMEPMVHVKRAQCREPIPSIVDDVISALLRRRDRLRRIKKDLGNILIDGFSSGEDLLSSPVVVPRGYQWQPNENVTFCKTSRLLQRLHSLLGDEILRMILLHTRMFLPTSNCKDKSCNWILICGPTLGNTTPKNLQALGAYSVKRDKRRKVDESPDKTVDSKQQANSTLSRFPLFYSDSYYPRIGLSHNHILVQETTSPESLLAVVVDLHDRNGKKRRKRWNRLRVTGVSVCEKVLASVKRCDFHRLLSRYCPLPECAKKRVDNERVTGNEAQDLQQLVRCFTPTTKVISYTVAVLTRVFPLEFWGSQRNLDTIIETVTEFIKLRRKEVFTNKRMLHGIHTTDMKWIHGEISKRARKSRSNHDATVAIVLALLRWLFRDFVIPLLRSSFYVTETEFSAKRVCYYRRPVWSKFRALSTQKLMAKQFRELTGEEVAHRLLNQTMGFSHLRLLPKATGVRPIAHLSRPQQVALIQNIKSNASKRTMSRDMHSEHEPTPKRQKSEGTNPFGAKQPTRPIQRSTNSILREVFDILTYECRQKENVYGSGLSGLSEFYLRYRNYITCAKKSRQGEDLHLHFASVDIEKCYDTINQKVMGDIAKRQISHEDYVIRQVSVRLKNKQNEGSDKLSRKFVGPPDRIGLLWDGHDELAESFSNVVIEPKRCRLAQRTKLCKLLKEHLSSHLVQVSGRFGQRYLVQTAGISQGSIVSMLLCNLYYGEIENLLLHEENPQAAPVLAPHEKSNFVARLVDDFLFISREESATATFLKKMYGGKQQLGVQINRDKTRVNKTIEIHDQEKSTIVSSSGRMFSWCGMLFDTFTGEVLMDYSRFHDGKIRDSLTVDCSGNEGTKIAIRMESFVRPRCLPILFDTSINSWKTVITNYYQMMLFAAAKSAEYFRCFGAMQSVTSNIGFLVRCVDSLTTHSQNHIRRNFSSQKSCQFMFRIDEQTASWLTWHAFCSVFQKLNDFPELTERFMSTKEDIGRPKGRALGQVTALAFQQFQLEKLIEV